MGSLPGTQKSTCLSFPSDRTGIKGMHAVPGLKLFFYGFCIFYHIWKTCDQDIINSIIVLSGTTITIFSDSLFKIPSILRNNIRNIILFRLINKTTI